jgi:glycosyltransferase involved in cell wall biosynthesis
MAKLLLKFILLISSVMQSNTLTTNTTPLFSIVIPCKNEEQNIGKLLQAIRKQSIYTADVQIIIADAGSTDKTLEIIDEHIHLYGMNISIIKGGYPATGRNKGASVANSTYVFFMDADILPGNDYLLEDVLNKMISGNLDLTTAYIRSLGGSWKDKLFWTAHNVILSLYWLFVPFSTGMFMCFKLDTFREMGGFDERIILGEDFDLTSRVSKKKFGVANNFIWNSNRRFMKMGYLKTIFMYTRVAFSKNYRLQDHKEYFEV